jgi:D-alanyl-D-alanine carboxypeptidase/D-alanyl-D-alanine-endopeptidase (penicillin-binding protein 4)
VSTARWWLVRLAVVTGVVVAACQTERSAPAQDTVATTTTTTAPDEPSTTATAAAGARPTAADERLLADLAALVPALPAASCLAVEGPGVAYALRPELPLVPASAVKLLTVTAALDRLGPDAAAQAPAVLAESDDRLAEALLAATGRAGGAATTAEAAAAARQVLDDGTVDLQGVVLADGSGHDRANRVTCAALLDVLQRPGTGPVLQRSLAVAGRTGTLADRFAGTALEGALRAKTGSLYGVAALAGVVDDGDPPLAFALVVNAPPGEAVPDDTEAIQAQVGAALVRWSDG